MADLSTAAGASPYSRDAIETRAAGDPDWLRVMREAAFDVFDALPLPTTKLEEWRYTDPRLLKWDVTGPGPVDAGDPAQGMALLEGRAAAARAVQVNGAIVHVDLPDELKAKGVVLMDLARAAVDHRPLVREHLGRHAPADSGKFVALNTALWSAGVLVRVPRGVRLEQPIRIARWLDRPGESFFPRTLVIAGEGSHVGIVEELHSPDFEQPVFNCGVVEIVASPAAEVQHVSIQRWGRGVHHLATQRTTAGRDAKLDTLVVNLGGSVARVDLAASLEGAGARSDMLGLYFGQNDQHFDHVTRQDHRVPHASSDLLYKGGLDDRARAVFRGLIKVFPGAQRTDAYQTNRNLILSRTAQSTSLPNLEIEADDVRCSHAATVGHLDDEELFYIMSRGVPRKDAERLVVFGFFGEVLDRLPMPDVVRELRADIEAKIG
ncbi:MAG: Fe-S cluster assembly protein SufD [Gemmatimonadetes bacterium]|nr:Fe-S cluster assembly protein SufD [Gemmatimonadota bacterium]